MRVIPLLVLGLVLTVKGGDLFVDAAVWIAEVSGLPRFLIGATVVSLATTLPELAVSLLATWRGAGGIAAGNAVGSVAANLGLILGLTLCLARGVGAREGLLRKLALMALSASALWLACRSGALAPIWTPILPCLCAAFLMDSVRSARRRALPREKRPSPTAWASFTSGLKFACGSAGIAVGARLLSDNGVALARLCGVSDGVVGATLVAVGTSLPELATAVAALRRGEASLCVGNIVGANVIDLTLILPLCAALHSLALRGAPDGGAAPGGIPLPLPRQTLALDLPFCLVLTLLAALPPLAEGRFRRFQGPALLAAYAAYVILVARQAG